MSDLFGNPEDRFSHVEAHMILPTMVAPASTLFSTNSLTAVARVRTTCPEQILCTEPLSIADILLALG